MHCIDAFGEPVDPFQSVVFHGIQTTPWATAVDDLRLEETIDCLGQAFCAFK